MNGTTPTAWKGAAVRGADRLAANLAAQRDDAMLFRRLATLACEGPEVGSPDEWRWQGPRSAFAGWAERLGGSSWIERVDRLAAQRLA